MNVAHTIFNGIESIQQFQLLLLLLLFVRNTKSIEKSCFFCAPKSFFFLLGFLPVFRVLHAAICPTGTKYEIHTIFKFKLKVSSIFPPKLGNSRTRFKKKVPSLKRACWGRKPQPVLIRTYPPKVAMFSYGGVPEMKVACILLLLL